MIAGLLQALRPSKESIRELALRETDTIHNAEFQPIARGPLVNAAVLLYVAAAAVVLLPIRLIVAIKERL